MSAERPTLPRVPIDEAMIKGLVHGFYAKVRVDAELGPIFNGVIGPDWTEHLAKLCDFWSSVMLLSGRYHGSPVRAHMQLKMVQPAHFARWLALFEETANELCPADAAALFISRAHNIARSLQLGMFYRPGITPPAIPAARD